MFDGEYRFSNSDGVLPDRNVSQVFLFYTAEMSDKLYDTPTVSARFRLRLVSACADAIETLLAF